MARRGAMPAPGSLPGRAAWTAWLAVETPRQARFAFRPRAAIRAAQSRRVREIVAHAYEHVPYYRETMHRRGLSPTDLRTIEDLARLPLIEREQLQRDPEYFVSAAAPVSSYLQTRTSGSSGKPVLLFRDVAGLFRGAAHRERQRVVIRRLAGRPMRYRCVFVDSSLTSGRSAGQTFRRTALLSSLRVEERHIPLQPVADTVAHLAAHRADVLDAYGSYLAALCSAIERDEVEAPAVRVITQGADQLPLSARRFITETLGIAVVSLYGAREAPQIGFQCERGGALHLNEDLYPIRIVDAEGGELGDGEDGHVVVSNLVNRGTVLLNYRLGDVAATEGGACPCGRSLAMLSLPRGRSHDWLQAADGTRVHPLNVVKAIEGEPTVWQLQVRQESRTLVRVELVATQDDRDGLHARVHARLSSLLGAAATVEIGFVDAISREASGKTRTVISHIGAGA